MSKIIRIYTIYAPWFIIGCSSAWLVHDVATRGWGLVPAYWLFLCVLCAFIVAKNEREQRYCFLRIRAWINWRGNWGPTRKQRRQVRELGAQGHSYHCACRQVYGDGACECDLYPLGYDPRTWVKRGEK